MEREERIGAKAALRAEVRRLGEALLAEPVEHVRVVIDVEERQTASVLQRGAEIDRQNTGLIRGLVHHTNGKGPADAVVLLSEADLRAPKLIDSSFHNNYIKSDAYPDRPGSLGYGNRRSERERTVRDRPRRCRGRTRLGIALGQGLSRKGNAVDLPGEPAGGTEERTNTKGKGADAYATRRLPAVRFMYQERTISYPNMPIYSPSRNGQYRCEK